jgi:acetyl esterase/lipase
MQRARRLLRIGILLIAATFVGVRPAEAQTDPFELLQQAASPGERIAYGLGPLDFGELRTPPGRGPFPVAILIHGGCWQAQLTEKGVPPEFVALDLLRPAADALARGGIATWNIEYPRIGNPGGGWPGTYRSISAAADHLKVMAKAHHLDLNHVIAVGHSSGGQLALWLAIRGKLPRRSAIYSRPKVRLRGVIDVDGMPDLRGFWPLQEKMCDAPVLKQFLGGAPDSVPDRYREGGAIDFLPIGIPQAFLIRDHPPETTALSVAYAQRARAAGDRVSVVMQQGQSHFDGINPQTADWLVVVRSAEAMVRSR